MNRRKLLWLVISIIFAIFIVWTITSQSNSFSWADLYEDIITADKRWIFAGVACMLGFIYFEGKAICVILKELVNKRPREQGVLYAASDIFFSSITPSATGGQPASAYFIMRDGVSGSVAMITLLINLVMYTFSLMITGFASVLFCREMFLQYSLISKVFVFIGFIILIFCAVSFLMLVFKENLMYKISNHVFDFLVKIRLIRNVQKRKDKMNYLLEEYRSCAEMLLQHKKMLCNVFLLNMLQRLCQISVSVCMFFAVGGAYGLAWKVWSVQSLALVGANGMPVPGAMGIIDYLLMEGFSHIPEIDNITNMELLVRGVSFYICVILCGLITLLGYFFSNRGERKKS